MDNLSKLNVPVFVKPYLDNEIPDATDFSFFSMKMKCSEMKKEKYLKKGNWSKTITSSQRHKTNINENLNEN